MKTVAANMGPIALRVIYCFFFMDSIRALGDDHMTV